MKLRQKGSVNIWVFAFVGGKRGTSKPAIPNNFVGVIAGDLQLGHNSGCRNEA
ncbi:MAG TPA: hypothetical protein VFI24_02945 [Pyrinomonadaceae bacterium]|nr:hypothetical protein [Pyrinomonadaceae bacterium]